MVFVGSLYEVLFDSVVEWLVVVCKFELLLGIDVMLYIVWYEVNFVFIYIFMWGWDF